MYHIYSKSTLGDCDIFSLSLGVLTEGSTFKGGGGGGGGGGGAKKNLKLFKGPL